MDRECPVARGEHLALLSFFVLTAIQVETMIERRLGEDFDAISEDAVHLPRLMTNFSSKHIERKVRFRRIENLPRNWIRYQADLESVDQWPCCLMIMFLLENATAQAKQGKVVVNILQVVISRFVNEHHVLGQALTPRLLILHAA